MTEKSHWVMDFETLSNCFIAHFEDYKVETNYTFIIWNKINHLKELLEFLEKNIQEKSWHISFNGLAFDSQITEHILKNKKMLLTLSAEEVARWIYARAQDTIRRSNTKEWPEFSEWKMKIKQVDLFKMNHWDNPAKSSSLKWLQYSMDWYNLQEMPIHHDTEITHLSQVKTIVEYCKNDVKSTKNIMSLTKEQINLRAALTAEYGINLYSSSEPRISKELFLHFLAKEMDRDKQSLKLLRTNREKIVVKDILLPYIQFDRPEFQDLHEAYKKLVINPQKIKGAFKYVVKHKGVHTEYGLGGVHGATQSGVYTETEDMIIMTSDVTSFYPNLAIRNGWAPAHLPKEIFCRLYEWFFEERKKIPKKDPKNYVYKIILNSTYGLSIEPNSFLYDPQLGMQITINGQMLLSMLYEMLSDAIPGSIPLMQNTDGLEMLIPKEHKQTYLDVCKKWEDMTQLQLEHDQYSKMIIGDVNNYIAVGVPRKAKTKEDWEKLPYYYPKEERKDEYWYQPIKCKGRFEFEELALHKNKSCLVIRKALHEFFVNDVPPEKYLSQNRNIFDYCSGIKIKGDWKFEYLAVEGGQLKQEPLHKIVRYFVSKTGGKIIKKHNSDGREIQTEAGPWLQTIYNLAIQKRWEDYNIDEAYYLSYIYKEIQNISPPKKAQLDLFE